MHVRQRQSDSSCWGTAAGVHVSGVSPPAASVRAASTGGAAAARGIAAAASPRAFTLAVAAALLRSRSSFARPTVAVYWGSREVA